MLKYIFQQIFLLQLTSSYLSGYDLLASFTALPIALGHCAYMYISGKPLRIGYNLHSLVNVSF